MSAYGIELFGLNEFAVRAPHWLAGVATIILLQPWRTVLVLVRLSHR